MTLKIKRVLTEEILSNAFMGYLEAALVEYEKIHRQLSHSERIEIYYIAYKESVRDLISRLGEKE